MLRGGVVADRLADKDAYSNSLDFGRALVQQGTSTGQRESDSGPLWGPGVMAQETPASIMSRNLHIWRKNNFEAPAAKAAEELDKLYAALPAGEVYDLTFQDMIDRNNSLRQRSSRPGREDNSVKNYGSLSPKNSFSGVNNENLDQENGQVKHDIHASNFTENKNSGPGADYSIPPKIRTKALSPRNSFGFNENFAKENGQVRRASNFKENRKSGSSSPSIAAKLRTMALSPMTVFPVVSSTKGQLSPTRFDELAVEKREKKQAPRRQVLYSDSMTSTSFRRESPFASPSASFRYDYGMVIGRNSFRDSFGRELNFAGPVRHMQEPQLELEDDRTRIPSADDMSIHRSPQLLHDYGVPSRPTVMPPHTINDVDCSICSATNLVLKISCLDCGKTFCLRCMDLETKDTPGGRQCKNACVPGRPVSDDGSINTVKKNKRSWSQGCWTIFGSCTTAKHAD